MSAQLESMLQQAIQAFQSGNIGGADLILKRVLQVDPKNLLALNVLGFIRASEANYMEAADLLKRAARISPNDASIQFNLAKALQDNGADLESLPHHQKAITLQPNNAGAFINYGITLHRLGMHNQALAIYAAGLKISESSPEIFLNTAITFSALRRYDEALTNYDKALSLAPCDCEIWVNKGHTLYELKRYDETIFHYDKALSLKPEIDWISGDLLHIKMKICVWEGLAESLINISKKVIANEKVVNPFPLIALNDDSLLHKKSSEIYAQDRYPLNSTLGKIHKRPKNKKIRIGYFSADFHNHATGYLMAELFELHNKTQFELIGFSFGPITNDEISQRLQKSFDQFIEVGNKSDKEIAQLSRKLNIDISVDLKGFTGGSRTGIFSYRAAPIQVNYLGYPGTMGIDYIDYIIADKTLIPLESQSSYTEKVVYMPNSYQVNDRRRLISDRQFTKQELGLPEDGFVFCCFNNNFKILPATFASWMRILRAVEGSVLWLFKDNSWVVENLKKEASNHGIDGGRLVFADHMPLSEHLARYRQADLFLDTLPYNAHTTSSDALWAGIPVLTLMGESFASRVAASLLNAMGLPELITNTQEDYEALALELATHPHKLADIKLKLAKSRLTTPLFDTPLFTKNLESAYIKMYEKYQAELLPEHIYI